jgi:integrase
VASLVVGKPRAKEGNEDVLQNCWEAEEAREFLDAAKAAGPQPAAFYTLAIETGARKAELCGLR